MPVSSAAEDRLRQAERNFATFEELRDGGKYLDWAATALFYAAVHLVDAHAVEIGRQSVDTRGDVFGDGHKQRFDYVRLNLRRALRDYEKLFDLSRDTRYRMVQPSAAALADYEERYRRIKATIEAFGVKL